MVIKDLFQSTKILYLALAVTLIMILFLGLIATFASTSVRPPALNVIRSLIYPFFTIVILIAFRDKLNDFLSVISSRIETGSGLEGWGIKLTAAIQKQAEKLPSPKGDGTVTLANIALLHTSFYSGEGTRRINDGLPYFQFEIIVVAPKSVMKRIESVTYHLEDSWPEHLRMRTIQDTKSRFKIKELANGTSIVRAVVKFVDRSEALELNRFIDLRPNGPRI